MALAVGQAVTLGVIVPEALTVTLTVPDTALKLVVSVGVKVTEDA